MDIPFDFFSFSTCIGLRKCLLRQFNLLPLSPFSILFSHVRLSTLDFQLSIGSVLAKRVFDDQINIHYLSVVNILIKTYLIIV